MSSKSQRLGSLLSKVDLRREFPAPPEGASLFEIGLLCVLSRHMTDRQALQSVKALEATFPDWNELRVAQLQEFMGSIKVRNTDQQRIVAADVKAYLTEIYWANHGFDLESLREDAPEAVKFFSELRLLGAAAAHFTLMHALGGEPPASPPAIKCLDRLGVMPKTASLRKGTEGMRELMPEKQRVLRSTQLGEVIELWCNPQRPSCWECVLVTECPHGKKVAKEYEAQQQRLDAQRKRDEERRRKEEERARKRAEAEAKKHEKEIERKRAADARRKDALKRSQAKVVADAKKRAEVERKRVEAIKQKAAEEKQRIAQAKKDAAAKKKAAAKAAADKKKAAAKKAAAKKAAAKKAAAKKTAAKKTAAKKPAAKKAVKKPATKKAPARKTAAKKKVVKKAPAKRAAKKTAAKKKAVKKTAVKKTAVKKTAAKKPAARKSTARKTGAKKTAAKKKTTRRR